MKFLCFFYNTLYSFIISFYYFSLYNK